MSYRDRGGEGLSGRFKIMIGLIILVVIVGALSIGSMWETNEAGWISIKQAALSGELTVYDKPGVFTQAFGRITKYKQAVTIGFGSSGEEGSADMGPIDVRFADSGKAKVYGNARFELPYGNDEKMLRIHSQYRSFEHLADTLLEKATAQVTGLTAQMMTSEDTYTGGRGKFIEMCLDQLEHGLYQTETKEVESEDPITKEKRRIRIVSAKKDETGKVLRLENELGNYGIRVTQYIIDRDFEYEKGINEQIEKQRDALNKTNTARAEALQASQEAITAKAKGDAAIAEAKAKQMVEKETATVRATKEAEVAKIDADREATIAKINSEKEKTVATIEAEKAKIEATKAATVAQIDAEQRLKVAVLEKQAADEAGQATVLKGKADATARELALKADGALKVKLDAWIKVNEAYAQAIQMYKGNWVPQVVMGGSTGEKGSTSGAGGAQDLVNLLLVKTAKDLALDIGASPTATPAPTTTK